MTIIILISPIWGRFLFLFSSTACQFPPTFNLNGHLSVYVSFLCGSEQVSTLLTITCYWSFNVTEGQKTRV